MKEILEPLYAEISVDIPSEALEARVKGAQLALRGMTASRALGLAVLAHRAQEHGPTVDWLQERMDNGGEGLNRSYAQEIGILATAVLIKSWQGSPSTPASVGALAVRSGVFLGWKPRVEQLVSVASTYLARASLEARRPRSIGIGSSSLAESAEEAFPDGVAYSAESVRTLHQDLHDLREHLATALSALSAAQRAGAEQTSILWWLFGERLLDGRRWSEPSEASRPLELAYDLARLSEFVPGPRGARNFLVQAIVKAGINPERDLTIGGSLRVVNEQAGLRSASIPDSSARITMPILCCLHHLDYPAQARPGGLHRSALQIAEQFYSELLIQRVLETSGNE